MVPQMYRHDEIASPTLLRVDFPSQGSFPSVLYKQYADKQAWFEAPCYADKSHTSAFFFIFCGPLTFGWVEFY